MAIEVATPHNKDHEILCFLYADWNSTGGNESPTALPRTTHILKHDQRVRLMHSIPKFEAETPIFADSPRHCVHMANNNSFTLEPPQSTRPVNEHFPSKPYDITPIEPIRAPLVLRAHTANTPILTLFLSYTSATFLGPTTDFLLLPWTLYPDDRPTYSVLEQRTRFCDTAFIYVATPRSSVHVPPHALSPMPRRARSSRCTSRRPPPPPSIDPAPLPPPPSPSRRSTQATHTQDGASGEYEFDAEAGVEAESRALVQACAIRSRRGGGLSFSAPHPESSPSSGFGTPGIERARMAHAALLIATLLSFVRPARASFDEIRGIRTCGRSHTPNIFVLLPSTPLPRHARVWRVVRCLSTSRWVLSRTAITGGKQDGTCHKGMLVACHGPFASPLPARGSDVISQCGTGFPDRNKWWKPWISAANSWHMAQLNLFAEFIILSDNANIQQISQPSAGSSGVPRIVQHLLRADQKSIFLAFLLFHGSTILSAWSQAVHHAFQPHWQPCTA
ncbi:hypothetical protein C8R44DRAFT_731377 [Mycena epipterygia]|nr:hypothetical protein C8R44DRAFT_731377 [Mycena epipterygia]